MSSSVKKNAITLTRGDTLRVKVDIFRDGESYQPVEGESVRFALKHPQMNQDASDYTDVEPLVLKEVPIDTMVLQLDPEDTKELGFGSYVYDMEITFEDGTVDTFIPASTFKLTAEVH